MVKWQWTAAGPHGSSPLVIIINRSIPIPEKWVLWSDLSGFSVLQIVRPNTCVYMYMYMHIRPDFLTKTLGWNAFHNDFLDCLDVFITGRNMEEYGDSKIIVCFCIFHQNEIFFLFFFLLLFFCDRSTFYWNTNILHFNKIKFWQPQHMEKCFLLLFLRRLANLMWHKLFHTAVFVRMFWDI